MKGHREDWDYRVVGINFESIQPSNPSQAAEKLGETFSKEFLEKEFPKEYVKNHSTNMALQCQIVIQIYGKRGWEHYQQSQLGGTAMLYFKKRLESKGNSNLTTKEEAIIQGLDELQKP
jgi:hypothetical protein